jgi:hypothetical protein
MEQAGAGITLSRLTRSDASQRTQLSTEFLAASKFQLTKLARHFRRDLDEMELLTYVLGLRDLSPETLECACTRALETMTRMPFVAELLKLADERSENASLYARPHDDFVDFPPTPFMAQIRELAKEIALDRFGKLYDELTDKEVFECSVAAAEIRREKLLGNESIRF